ncbi:protein HOTHEAD-like isoform X2 [Apium graveolens]|uniref:protein HOTHEAD-like isoform X2 n=1 Tax=Apium graveolens TaxID=4045 RepID=UPI003D7B25D2
MVLVYKRGLLNHAAIFGIISLLSSACCSEKAPYSTFARDATAAPQEAYYDYIIIGGGTSGCALAATLSQGSKVLLIERGGLPYGNPTISNIRAINTGFYSRASPDFVTRAGWDPELVQESYEWVEKKIVFEPELQQWQSAVRDGLLEAGVLPDNGFTFDHLIGTKIGGSTFDQNGDRHTAADLLEYAHPSNISVHLNATVQRILFISGEKLKSNGVVYEDSNGDSHWAYINNGSNNEIIVCAGAIGSPQLLMLSGIGPAEHLKANGIEVILDQPMVGQGMADNPLNVLLVPSTEPLEFSLPQIVGITGLGNYIETGSATIELGWANTLPPELLNQTEQIYKATRKKSPEVKAAVDSYQASSFQAGLIAEKVIGPASSGHLELKTLDAKDNPKITFNYFEDPQDLQKCVMGMKTLIRVIESKAVSKFRHPTESIQLYIDTIIALPLNLRPRHLSASFSLEQYCIDTVMTAWHYHGGCHVHKVVDQDYKVVGVDALRVVDGSTFYFDSPGTNPQATLMMLGRYMGQKFLQERSSYGI